MSEHHSAEWHEGYGAGRHRGFEDASAWIDRAIADRYAMKHVSADQMVALQQLARDFSRWAQPPVQPHWIPSTKETIR